MNDEEIKPNERGEYINPDELNRIARDSPGVFPGAREALKRAALEITRQRSQIDILHAQLDI